MSLNCAISINQHNVLAQTSPAPQATLTVYNPNASAVAVTGIQLLMLDALGNPLNAATNFATPALGPGQVTVVPSLGTVTFGPFPVVLGNAANMNQYLTVNVTTGTPGSNPEPGNNQPASIPQMLVQLGAIVTATDGSSNTASMDSILFSFSGIAPIGFQGGVSNFNYAPNSGVLAAVI